MNYITSLTESPSNFDILQMFYTEERSLMCADCGCQFLMSEVDSSYIHSAKTKRKPFEYGGKGVKIFHQERCPVCMSHKLANLKGILS